jgi:uncharacterized membrane protein
MGHGHDHRAGDAAVSRTTRRRLGAAVIGVGVLTIAGMVVLWPRHDVRAAVRDIGFIKHVYEAKVIGVGRGPCRGTEHTSHPVSCTKYRFRLTQGPDRGEQRTIEFSPSASTPDLSRGDTVVLDHLEHAQRGFDYAYSDRQRRPVLLWLTVIFAVAVIALGRLRGLGALVGLGASIAVILVFILPSMLDGNSAPLVAIVGASAIAFVALYLANGFRPMTTVALLSTLAALALTVVLATVFTELAHFAGTANEDALLVRLGTSSIDLKGLLLAGMVLGATGALDDITVTQASAVGELAVADPSLSRRDLYRSGLRIGRDHISSTVNTLALAYAGASLPLLILFTLSGRSLGAVANGETVAVEIVATLVGSIGLVAAVPISTWFGAVVATEHDRREQRAVRPAGVGIDERDDTTAEPPATRRERRAQRPRFATRRPKPARTPAPAQPAPAPTPRAGEDLLEPRDESDFWK